MIDSALTAGLQGVRNGTLGLQDAANRIAQNGTTQAQARGGNNEGAAANGDAQAGGQAVAEAGGLAEPIVDLKLNQRGVEASIEVVKAADETLGTLLDEKA